MAPLIAVDIGNSSIKVAAFSRNRQDAFPTPLWVTVVDTLEESVLRRMGDKSTDWYVASVHRRKENELTQAVESLRPGDRVVSLSHKHADIALCVDSPEQLGEDRIFAAVAANVLRGKDQPAIVVDTGTAITIDAISSTGQFLGGAILPGLAMSARALHSDTDVLPEIDTRSHPPSTSGKNTTEAIQVGIIRGAAGAIDSLANSFLSDEPVSPLRIIAGGDSKTLLPWLNGDWLHLPDLVVQGIAIAAQRL